ncbi:A/G-specific adenine glycosylase [Georgfuchsia toluolica]|uniref:A/G-specific adenine glycosylase n=1 Tax=Georgfuchsia toluolica TaxID=424218 RepID=UPI001FE4EF4F|nr:A/G-specific adenine glycosylase [Georgfuchsia toluolica]
MIIWHRDHGRHDLPWQNTQDPYRVWLSEIMLQQTQVATVIPYYEKFLARFPTLKALAAAPVEAVMGLWSGLGYYARARNLHACAQAIMHQHGGMFPHDAETIAQLPGIGRSTANSIAAFCFGARKPILDGNVKRVLTRQFGIEGFPGQTAVEKKLWALAEALLPKKNAGIYNQAQMDLGSLICTRSKPLCDKCPVDVTCVARQRNRVAELPAKKPKRAIPERDVTLLMLVNDSSVLLELRPSSGIWGGLLSLPELPPDADAGDYAKSRFGCRPGKWLELPVLTHTFTHFRLRISTLRAEVEGELRAMENAQRWIGLDELAEAPLPAPIRAILSKDLS